MLNKREIGTIGESLAENHLVSAGHLILERNWRYSRAEIDLISRHSEILVFTEVKTRTYEFYGSPEDSVTKGKEALIMDAAQRYMEKIDHDWEVRFDIISIIVDKSGKMKRLEHFEDAFF